jgi:hypothetical protein
MTTSYAVAASDKARSRQTARLCSVVCPLSSCSVGLMMPCFPVPSTGNGHVGKLEDGVIGRGKLVEAWVERSPLVAVEFLVP